MLSEVAIELSSSHLRKCKIGSSFAKSVSISHIIWIPHVCRYKLQREENVP